MALKIDDIDPVDPTRTVDGTLIWKLEKYPGKKQDFGGELKVAAYLSFNKSDGETFTMQELRQALGEEDKPNAQEHLNRRLRELRKKGWDVPTKNRDDSLPPGVYRLVRKGEQVWVKGKSARRDAVNQKTRRIVLDRDGHRCVVCGVGAGEAYPGEPNTKAVMTVGHRIPGQRLGKATPDNLRTECQRCNQPLRDLVPDPHTYDEVWPAVKGLPRNDKLMLLEWLLAGQRSRSTLDNVYDRARQLAPSEKDQMIKELKSILGMPFFN